MPGIFGIVSSSPVPAAASLGFDRVLRSMASAMEYRPWYSTQFAAYPELGVWAGYTGSDLARDRSVPARTGTVVVLSTGEKSPGDGPGLVAGTGTYAAGAGSDELLREYLQRGELGLFSMRGNWAGLVLDRRRAQCIVFTDRFGRERLFLHQDGDSLYFASEAKAILAAIFHRGFDPVGLGEFLACGCTLGSHSLYHGIGVMPGGTAVVVKAGVSVENRTYFEPGEWEALTRVTATEFLDAFPSTLRASVNCGLQGEGPVGVSLTGGLDSRMILAMLEPADDRVQCYTFGSMYRATADVVVAARVAAIAGFPHQVLELGEDFLRRFDSLLSDAVYVSDGYLGWSGAAELYLNGLARLVAPVRTTGNWGGELMRAVRAFKCGPVPRYLADESLALAVHAVPERLAQSAELNPVSFALHKQLPAQGYGRYAIERSQVSTWTPFLASEVVKWLYRVSPDLRSSTQAVSAVLSRRPELLTVPTDTGMLGRGSTTLRAPYRLYCRALAKAEYMTSHGAPHWVARASSRLTSGILERRFLGVDKFQHFRLWSRSSFSEAVRQTLRPGVNSFLDRWFDMRMVQGMVEAHVAGRANYLDDIDKLMTVAVAGDQLLAGPDRKHSAKHTTPLASGRQAI